MVITKTYHGWIISTIIALIYGATEEKKKSIDEILMEAASYQSAEMLDLFHDMGDGKMMTMVELDILMDIDELANYRSTSQQRTKRKAYKNISVRWPDGKVPYQIQNSFTGREKSIIKSGIADWEKYTCLTFQEVQPSDERKYPSRILFRDGGGCYSRLGMIGGVQPISLGRGCRSHGIVVHEIGHAIGWIHEQARPDRDEYISINFNQIPVNWRPQYRKLSANVINDHDVEYDYTSIMHYSANSFGDRTIVTLDPAFQNKIGQREGLSFRDVKLANIMYMCADSNNCERRRCPGEGFQGKNCQCYCPTRLNTVSPPYELCDMTETIPTTIPTTTTSARPITTAAPPTQDCRDMLGQNCESLKQNGQCESDVEAMMIYCQKKCGFCKEDIDNMCMDFDDACPFIANSGYCNRTRSLSAIFHATCPKSCKICIPDAIPCAARDFVNKGNQIVYSNPFSILLMIIMVLISFI